MSASIDINGKKLLPIKEASASVGYSRDYITRLARERKIVATQIGRKWYVDIKSLRSYSEVIHSEQEIKKRHLSLERKHELAMREAKARKVSQSRRHVSKRAPALLVAVLAVVSGVGLGFLFEKGINTYSSTQQQIASVNESLPRTPGLDFSYSESVEVIDEGMLVANFVSRESQRDLSRSHMGIVLLADSATSSEVAVDEYFSDPVQVVRDEYGNEVIVQVDMNGNPIGETFPFVIVPVNSYSP